MKALTCVGLLSILLPTTILACLWDRDTLRDETSIAPDLFDLITGQFPHHGDGYYHQRVKKLKREINGGGIKLFKRKGPPKNDKVFGDRNDLAVAYIRLREFTKAEEILRQNLAQKPGDYFTLSNLGVLEKKRGNYKAAAIYIEKALAIRPEGHLGIGDWYLKMIQHRIRSQESVPTTNFLGESYAKHHVDSDSDDASPADKTAASPEKTERFNRLKLLVQNDQTFADGFVVLGDFLAARGDLNLAFLAYTRAIELKHPNDQQIRNRRKSLLAHFEQAASHEIPDRMAFWREQIAKAELTLTKAQQWLPQFQAAEAQLAKSMDSPPFGVVETKLEKQGIKRYRP